MGFILFVVVVNCGLISTPAPWRQPTSWKDTKWEAGRDKQLSSECVGIT